MENNASRLGIKGDYDLDLADMNAFYKAEFEIHPDDGKEDSVTGTGGNGVDQVIDQRDIYGGIKTPWARVQAGHFDSPLKDAQMDVDRFSDLEADIKQIMAGENRYENQLMVSSPALWDSLTVNVSAIQQEGADIDGDGTAEADIGDSLSASIVYEQGDYYAALAMDKDSTDGLAVDNAQGPIDITRATFGYAGDRFAWGGLYQSAEDRARGSNAREDTWLVSAAWRVARLKFKAQAGVTDGEASDQERELGALGVDLALNKQSKVFTYYVVNRLQVSAPGSDQDQSTLGVGFQHKF